MNTAGASTQQGGGTASLGDVLTRITSESNPQSLNAYLKTFAPKDVRETILASILPGSQDPLSVLDPQHNTLGCLYILYAV